MSVHNIYIKDGCKMMHPILNREEYVALRDSDENRMAEKSRMVQMNYSCLPNDDGSLKGSKRMSTTVGMDVDLAPSDSLNGEKTSVENIQTIIDHALEIKDELGLLMLERSATKGLHIVFRRRPELSQEENLKWASKLLGVAYDKNAKDITRVFYTPADKLVFLDDEIFSLEEVAASHEGTAPSHEVAPASHEETRSEKTAPVYASKASLKAFDLCVEAAGLNADKLDVWGEHNWHNNLMAVLSVGLPKLMSKEQLLAVVKERLRNYGETADCRKLIDYFYEKYTADKGFMPVTLRNINATAQNMANCEENEDDKELKELTAGWQPPKLPNKIPRLMKLLAGNYDPRFREMLMLSSLPVLSAHASRFRATYLNGRVIGPQQYVAVIGSSGSGKGNCTALYNEMVRYTLQQNDDQEWQKVKENAELRDKKANAKERPPKYHPKLRLFETTSKSSILELQTNLGPNGMLLGHFSEVDGLSSSARAAYSDISVLLRKGWEMDVQRQYYMSDSTCNTYTQMSISLLMAGTPKAMLERMFSDNNCEGGLMQRCIPVLVPKTKRAFRPPRQNYLSEEEKKERDQLIIKLYQKDLALGEGTQLLDTPMTNRAIGQWFDELEERYNDGLLSEAEADLSHRCGEMMLRTAIPLVALYGGETKEIVDFCRWVGETAHYSMCRIFGHRVQNNIAHANELLAERLDSRKTAEPLLNKMPMVFTIKQFKEMREKEGQSPEVRMLLSRYCKNGKLERVGRGVYRKLEAEESKCNIVTDTKLTDQ